MKKIAIITSHPIQYYAPWFCHIANSNDIALKVFYLWNFGVTNKKDTEFKQSFQWDIPLLDGYEYEFVPNVSSNPGTHHFFPAIYQVPLPVCLLEKKELHCPLPAGGQNQFRRHGRYLPGAGFPRQIPVIHKFRHICHQSAKRRILQR